MIDSASPETKAEWANEWARHLYERPLPMADPRPDLVGDRHYWECLLNLAYVQGPGNAFHVLKGFRCLGARLAQREGRMVIEPGEISPDEYGELRAAYLRPLSAEIVKLLNDLGVLLGGHHGQE